MPSSPLPAKAAAAKAYNSFNLVSFTIGAKASNTINVAVQLKDARGKNVAGVVSCECYLSDNADGSTVTATVPTSNIAIGTNGVILGTILTNKALQILSTVLGAFDLNLIQTASPVTYYLCVMLPDGSVVISSAITF